MHKPINREHINI